MYFGYPQVGRSGLGNALFPWARCAILCADRGLPMLAPRWFRLRLGPYIRRERDKRQYHRLFLTRHYVTGVRRLILLSLSPRLGEHEFPTSSEPPKRHTVVVFKGMGHLFRGLEGRQRQILDALTQMVRPHLVPTGIRAPFIAVHVRCGDFSAPSSSSVLRSGSHNFRLPLAWYVSALRSLRSACGPLPAMVFSDGYDHELQAILREPNTHRWEGASAISDLLALSRAQALIASGSTFSMWASYLGQMPTIWYPGQRRQFVTGNDSLEPEWDGGGFPAAFIEGLLRRRTDLPLQ